MRIGLLSAAMGLAVVSPLLAQDTRPENSGPPTAEQMLNEMLNPTTRPESAPSTQPGEKNATVQPAGRNPISLASQAIREGSDVVDRTGRLRKKADSLYQEFVFDNNTGEVPLSPMLVLPDLKLMSMEDAVAATKPDLRFTVSGTVTEYKGNNYILLESGPDDVGRRISGAKNSRSSTRPASADELLNDMLKSTGDSNGANGNAAARSRPARMPAPAVAVDLRSGPGAIAPGAPLLNVLREQSEIIDRTARLTHSADGRQLELTFEADATAMQDPPLIILPNLKLAAMETAAAVNNREPRFRATGIVTEYRGRNYILLEKVVVLPEINQQF